MLTLLWAGMANAESTYIVAGSLVDPLKAKLIRNPVVEIQDGRIVSVTSGGAVPDNVEVIKLGSATLLPGLADLHTHLTWNPSDIGYTGLGVSSTDEAVRGVVNARKNGTFLSINAYTPIYMIAKGEEMGMLPESVEKARKLADKRLANYRKAIKLGAKIVYGSDSATIVVCQSFKLMPRK